MKLSLHTLLNSFNKVKTTTKILIFLIGSFIQSYLSIRINNEDSYVMILGPLLIIYNCVIFTFLIGVIIIIKEVILKTFKKENLTIKYFWNRFINILFIVWIILTVVGVITEFLS